MSRDIGDLIPECQQACVKLMELAALEGILLKVICTYRSYEEQAGLYAKGRSRPGPKVTNARPGQSYHQHRRAVDFAFGDPSKPKAVKWVGPWKRLGELAESCGWAWGGRWKTPDRPHVEWKDKTIKQLMEEHDA